MKNILIIDDDVELCGLLKSYFTKEGFDFECVHEGKNVLDLLAQRRHHLVILDVMLPDKDGFEVLKEIRSRFDIPIIMLTAKGDHVDRIVGLEIGADDYICKPFNTRELSARIRAVLRRIEDRPHNSIPAVLNACDLELSLKSRSVTVGGEEVALTNAEFRMLEILLSCMGTLVSLDRLSAEVLGRRYSMYDRSISVHMSNLRRKLGPYPDGSERIKTVRSEGFIYVFPKTEGFEEKKPS